MKQLHLTAIYLLTCFLSLNAQPSAISKIPDDFTQGTLLMPDNSVAEGHIKNNLKKNGEIIFLSHDGRKTKFTASQLSGFSTGDIQYLAIDNTFYRLVTDGSKIKLLRKASNPPVIQYNGSEPILVSSVEGSYDDYFIQTVSTKKLQLVRRKDFTKVFLAVCSDCATISENVKTNKLGFAEIEQVVAAYNTCE